MKESQMLTLKPLILWIAIIVFHAFSRDSLPAIASDGSALTPIVHSYYSALEARSTDQLGNLVEPSLTVYEGVHKNVGWIDFRDNHIGPEMKEWKKLVISDRKVLRSEIRENLGFVTGDSIYEITTSKEVIRLAVAETFILTKVKASWKILHIHFTGKKLPEKK